MDSAMPAWKRPRAGAALALLLSVAACLCACAAADAPLATPAWAQVTFGSGEADVVAAIDLRAMRADSIFGPLVTELARRDDMGVLLEASQIDLVAGVDRGHTTTWLAIIHGVDGAPTRSDIGSSASDVVVVPGAWLLGEGPAFERARASAGRRLSPIAMPSRALMASTVQGRAFPRPKRPVLGDATEGLRDASVILLGGDHLEVVIQCRYEDEASARHAASVARLMIAAMAPRSDAAAVLARALTRVDFDVRGDEVSLRVTVADDLRDVLEHYARRAVN
jgi:hypothetical protein